MIEKKFIEQKFKKLNIKEFLEKELKDAGYSYADVKKTPLGTRITIHTKTPGRVIGREGKNIDELTERLKEFGVENPILEVEEIENPALDPTLMARYVARGLERGFSFKAVVHRTLERIKEAGARKARIRLSGKVISKRHSTWLFPRGKFRDVKHTGDQAERKVKEGKAVAHTQPGEIGVKVKIIPPKGGDRGETQGTEETE